MADKAHQIEIRDLRISETDKLVLDLKQDKSKLEESKDAWYNNKILWFSLGVVITGYVVKH